MEKESKVNVVSLDSLQTSEMSEDYGKMFEDEATELASKNEELTTMTDEADIDGESTEDSENKKRFVRSLNPEYKANMLYARLYADTTNYPDLPRYGHAKRIYLRKLIREAKKGRLDKYFE